MTRTSLMVRLGGAWRALYYLSIDGPCSLGASRRIIASILRADVSNEAHHVDVPVSNGVVRLDSFHRSDWQVFRGVFGKRTYETEYENTIVIDIGAHRGIFSAYALQHGCSVLLAYEPEAKNFRLLEENIGLSSRGDQVAAAHKKAVGRENGLVEFYVYDEGWSHSTCPRSDKRLVRQTSVESLGLDDVLDEAKAYVAADEKIILKLDVEGAEFDIIEGASLPALQRIDELFVETHDFVQDRFALFEDILRRAGLRAAQDYDHDAGRHRLHRYVRRAGSRR